MTKDKLTLSDLANLLAEKSGISQKTAEDFLKQFFVSLENGLLANDQIKIKNFGTFKLQWNEARKSVNVNTGEEIVISGFYKVVFAPDNLLKEKVNEPFAHLEPVVLDEVNVEDNKELNAVAPDPLRTFNEQASEIKNILSELKHMGQEVETPATDEFDPEEIEDNLSVDPDEDFETEENTDTIESEVTSLENEQNPTQEVYQAEDVNQKEEEIVEEIPETIENSSVPPQNTEQVSKINESPVKKSGVRMSVPSFILVLVGAMILSAAVIYGLLYKDHLREMLFGKPVQAKVVVIADTVKVVIRKKVVENVDSTRIQPAANAEKVVVTDTLAFLEQPRTYTRFKATEELKEGTRLTRLATKYYGHKDFWVYIYEANMDLIKNPDVLPLGVTIKIPELDPKLVDKENKVCIRFARDLQTKYLNINKK